MTSDRKTLWFYGPQSAAVQAILTPFLGATVRLNGVRDGAPLRGVEHGTFVHVARHPRELPHDIEEELARGGWNLVILDDTYPRILAAERLEAAQRQ